MKMIFSALVVLTVSTLAQAMPAVGDTSTFQGTTLYQGNQAAFQTVMTLTQFDASKNSYIKTTTTTANGMQPQVEQKTVAASELITDATINYVLANCASQNGVLEAVTVPAGNFNTCRISQKGATYNVGAVPFGIVKGTDPASQTVLQLSSFQLGH